MGVHQPGRGGGGGSERLQHPVDAPTRNGRVPVTPTPTRWGLYHPTQRALLHLQYPQEHVAEHVGDQGEHRGLPGRLQPRQVRAPVRPAQVPQGLLRGGEQRGDHLIVPPGDSSRVHRGGSTPGDGGGQIISHLSLRLGRHLLNTLVLRGSRGDHTSQMGFHGCLGELDRLQQQRAQVVRVEGQVVAAAGERVHRPDPPGLAAPDVIARAHRPLGRITPVIGVIALDRAGGLTGQARVQLSPIRCPIVPLVPPRDQVYRDVHVLAAQIANHVADRPDFHFHDRLHTLLE